MKKDVWEIVHIPEKQPLPPTQQPTVNVFASLIEPKLANTLIRRLNQIAPLENLRHVKRVRKESLDGGKIQLSVILCLACENDNQSDSMPNDLLELIKSYQLSAFITKVCKYPASSKEEWEEQCKLWPTSFHPPTYNIDGITGFSEEDSQSVSTFMKFAVELAKSGDGRVVNAAVIVDPSVKQVIASACDQIFSWYTPTNKTCGGTSCFEHPKAFNYPVAGGVGSHETLVSNGSLDEAKRLCSGVSCLYPWQWAERQLHTRGCCNWNPLRHAAIVAIEYSADRDRRLFPGLGHIIDTSIEMDHMQSSSASAPAKRQKTTLSNVTGDEKLDDHINDFPSDKGLDRPYLCTGYDIYLVWEPCTMCAMALVHQRVRRIFYAFPNPNAGALGSVHRLQGERSLNHHYAVFRVLLPEEVLDG
ncbi:hypothetical protein L1049_026367 [Liquidambar formosana]|uniref:CMP/dCMP-type deaminase domain-containing protein n=1 Tax=Liquidambar formosana TaxID=63359 RepID=A0AAP0ND86_LIQFO